MFTALRRAISENIQKESKLTIVPTHCSLEDVTAHEVNGGIRDPTATSQHILSANNCLPNLPLSYPTSAKITEHFPTKVLTPAAPTKPSQLSPRRAASLRLNADARAPVATVEDPDTPELDDTDGVEERSFTPKSEDSQNRLTGTSCTSSETVQSRTSSLEDNSGQVGLAD